MIIGTLDEGHKNDPITRILVFSPRPSHKIFGFLFPICLIVSTGFSSWAILSTVVDAVSPTQVSMIFMLPLAYWVGFASLLAATAIWFKSGETKGLHFLLPFWWMINLFIVPQLIEVHPRGLNSYLQALGTSYVQAGDQEQFWYFPYLSLHYLSATIAQVLSIDYLTMIRLSMVLLYLAVSLALLLFFPGGAVPERRSKVLGALVGIALLLVTTILDYHPQTLGFIVLLLSLYLFSKGHRSLLFIAVIALVVTHALSAMLLAYFVALSVVFPSWFPALMKSQRRDTAGLALAISAVFAAWFMYSNPYFFPMAVRGFFANVIQGPFALFSAIYFVSPTRPGHGAVSWLTFAFLGIVVLWLVSCVWGGRLWRLHHVHRLSPLLPVFGMPLLVISTGNFTYEGLLRAYLFSTPLLALLLARESVSSRSVFVFLPTLLILGVIILYARESVELPPSTEFAGAIFVARNVAPETTTVQGSCLTVGALTGTLPDRTSACFVSAKYLRMKIAVTPGDFTLTILSPWDDRVARWYLGDESLSSQLGIVREGNKEFGKTYSNGDYEVFLSPGQ